MKRRWLEWYWPDLTLRYKICRVSEVGGSLFGVLFRRRMIDSEHTGLVAYFTDYSRLEVDEWKLIW